MPRKESMRCMGYEKRETKKNRECLRGRHGSMELFIPIKLQKRITKREGGGRSGGFKKNLCNLSRSSIPRESEPRAD